MQAHSLYRILLLIGSICTVVVARAGDGGGGVVARAILDGSKNQLHKDSTVTVEDSAFFNAFDLVSGKVNKVSYQPGMPDAFYHKYVYDAENRITNVLTSADSINWDNDAYYQYYDHGPLARTVLGEQQVQGVNHAYNLQGWLKVFNPDIYNGNGYTLKADGSNGSVVGKPAYQVALNYFDGDYKAISGATQWSGATALGGNYHPLYNGNISSMAVNIEALNNPLLYNYQYDQLNRLVAMDAWKKNSSWGSLTSTTDYQERVSYDPNGNILSYKRNGTTVGGKQIDMDDLNYNYITGTNRLGHVLDNVSATNYSEDIDAQVDGNYKYDLIGNLVKDSAENITSISWTVYGKIGQIKKTDGTTISYTYDPGGNRISKTVDKTSPASSVTTWYARDAQGNVMSVYEAGKSSLNDGHLTQTELHLYGSSRLGLLRRSVNVDTVFVPADTTMTLLGNGLSVNFGRGNKLFELSNHLGNVLVTVNDKKLGVSSNTTTIDYFNPQVASAQDYYPFGMLQPGRSYNVGGYRYGFNGKENDNEVKGDGNQQDYGMRIYDPRLGKFLSVDPLTKNFAYYSPYHFAGNNPIQNKDLDGKEPQDFRRNWISKQLFDLNTKSEVGERDWTLRVTDSKLGQVDAYMVYDQWTKTAWFVTEQEGGYYYLKNDNGNSSEMTIRTDKKRGINIVAGGAFEKFNTQDRVQAKYAAESSDILATCVFGFAATGAALPFMTATGGAPFGQSTLLQRWAY